MGLEKGTHRATRGYYRTFLYHNYPELYFNKYHLLTFLKIEGNLITGVFCDRAFRYVGEVPQALHSLAMDSHEYTQDTKAKRTTLKMGMSDQDPGVADVLSGAASVGRLVTVPNTQSARIGMLDKAEPGPFRKEIKAAFPDVDFSKYQHSSSIGGKASSAKLHKLYQSEGSRMEKECTPQEFSNMWALSVVMQIQYDGKGGVLWNEPLSEEEIDHFPLKDASNAYPDEAFNIDGVKLQSKREEAVTTKFQIMIAERYGITPLNTYKPAKKAEVLEALGKPDAFGHQKCKDCRYIYCCCTMEFLSFAASGLYDQMAKGKGTNDARTLPVTGGMYHDLIHRLSRSVDGTFDEKEASLGGEVFSIDFQGWEYSFGLLLKLMYFLGIMGTLKEVRYPYSLAGAVASVLCPIIVISAAFAILAYDLMPSGTLPTLDLNCFGNDFVSRVFIQKFILTLEEAAEVLDKNVMGDDLVSRLHQWINQLKDFYSNFFGMKVAQVERNSFLQRTIDFENRACVYPLARLLNKIYHSPGSQEDKRQQVYSYYLQANGHFEEFKVLKKIVGKPKTFAAKADGDLLGFYNDELDDDTAVMLLHEPRDPHDVLVRFAFGDIHNSSPELVAERVDTKAGRELFLKRHPDLLLP